MSNPIVVFDIDGVVRDVAGSYRRAIADTVEHFTTVYRPTSIDIDQLKSEGIWNNDWEATGELIYRYFEARGQTRDFIQLDYEALVDFFQSRYRGSDAQNWTGYICQEPLLLQPSYLENLSAARILWGFFSGAPRAEAAYVLERRLGLKSPVLMAMEDAPGKPDPTGLLEVVRQLEVGEMPVLYVGDTVADLYTVAKARIKVSNRCWIGVGILPPHVQESPERRDAYAATLKAAGANVIFGNVQELTASKILAIISKNC
ncbi:MAG: TIGR01548 family HAD-type hydrolase [Chamaesiphon sp.]